MIYSIEGDSQNELKAYEKAIEYSPNDNSLKITYSLVLIESNREKEAIQIVEVNEVFECQFTIEILATPK